MSVSIVKRNNVLAGIFVIGSLTLAVVVAAILGDVIGRMGEKNEFTVRFPTSVGVTGLQPGAEVTFAGLPVGRVKSIQPHRPDGPDTAPEAMDVTVLVDTRIMLHENAVADLTPPILGGVSRINFATAGTGRVEPGSELASLAENNNNGVLEAGEVIGGRFAPSILAQLGFGAEDARNIREAIAAAKDAVETAKSVIAGVERMTSDFEPRFGGMLDDAGEAVANVRGLTGRLTEDGDWATMVTGILTRADETVAQGPVLMDEVRGSVESFRSMVDARAEGLDRIMANVEAVTERIRFENMDQVEDMIKRGTLALASFQSVGQQADTMLTQMRPDIAATLANSRSLSRKAVLLTDELRAAPWRVLKQPSQRELRREPLYAAARAYADAVADLRAASEALDAAVSLSGPDAAGRADAPAEIARIATVVQAAYDRYADAERALLETLRESNP
ncbi:MAG: MlaD family protein [Phycisphaerales bacterium]|nr:MCE family protein [Planctomycetota bacterium]MCH8508094.1 MlaD family protein [Phycisphaerales bacterium]